MGKGDCNGVERARFFTLDSVSPEASSALSTINRQATARAALAAACPAATSSSVDKSGAAWACTQDLDVAMFDPIVPGEKKPAQPDPIPTPESAATGLAWAQPSFRAADGQWLPEARSPPQKPPTARGWHSPKAREDRIDRPDEGTGKRREIAHAIVWIDIEPLTFADQRARHPQSQAMPRRYETRTQLFVGQQREKSTISSGHR